MRAWLPIAILVLLVIPSHGQEKSTTVRIDQFDGTRVVGTLLNEVIAFDLDFDQLEVPVNLINRFERKSADGLVKIQLLNRDQFTAKLLTETFKMETVLGEISLDANESRSIHFLERKYSSELPESAGLVAFYDFEQFENGRVINQVAPEFHLAVNKSRVLSDSGASEVCDFDGKTTIKLAHDDRWCPRKLTLSAWIKPAARNGNYEFLMGKSSAGSWSGGYAFAYMSGDKTNLCFYLNGYQDSVTKVPIESNKWVHITGTCDGREVRLYKNGKPVQTTTLKGQKIVHTADAFTIGSDTKSYHWTGQMDDIAFYGRSLSDAEVLRLYERTKANR